MTIPDSAEHQGARVTTEETSPSGAPVTATKASSPAGRTEDMVLAAAAAAPAASERDYQRAFLLLQLQEARGGHLAKGKANRFPRAVQRELNLSPTTANNLRDELVEQGYARAGRKGGSLTYEITDAGRDLLRTLPQKPIPTDGRPPAERDVSEEVRKFRRTFLLFQLFEAEGHALEQKIVNRFREPGRKFLDLRAPAANNLRKALADEGLIEVARQGRNATYRLTPSGREELGATAHFPDVEITLSGRILNELLEAARDSAKQFESSTSARPGHRRTEPQPVHSGAAKRGVSQAVAVAACRLTIDSARSVSFLSVAFSSSRVCWSRLATSFRPSCFAQVRTLPYPAIS